MTVQRVKAHRYVFTNVCETSTVSNRKRWYFLGVYANVSFFLLLWLNFTVNNNSSLILSVWSKHRNGDFEHTNLCLVLWLVPWSHFMVCKTCISCSAQFYETVTAGEVKLAMFLYPVLKCTPNATNNYTSLFACQTLTLLSSLKPKTGFWRGVKELSSLWWSKSVSHKNRWTCFVSSGFLWQTPAHCLLFHAISNI